MRRKLHLIIYIAICLVGLLGLMPALVACSDSDDHSSEQEELTWEQERQLKQLDAIRTVLARLADVDSLSNDFYQRTYQPTYGKVLDESAPFVRAVKADDQERALDLFRMMVGYEDMMTATNDGYRVELKLPAFLVKNAKGGLWGKLTYHVGDGVSRIAYVDVEITNMPNLQRIDFIPSKLWGDNVTETTALKLGELVEYMGNAQLGGKGRGIWMCVRENKGPYDGIMVHLDVNCNENFAKWMDKGDGTNPKNGCWMPYFSSNEEDVKAYLAFLNDNKFIVDANKKYLEKEYPGEVNAICPPGFLDNAYGYVYQGSQPAAIVMEAYYGSWVWYMFYHDRHCNFYVLPKECKTGKGGSVHSIDYVAYSSWTKKVWNQYKIYTLSAIHFETSLPQGMVKKYDPADFDD